MSLLSLLLAALCLVSADGFQCWDWDSMIERDYQFNIVNCPELNCRLHFYKNYGELMEYADCACYADMEMGCFYNDEEQEIDCCCDEDLCNKPNRTELKCWTGSDGNFTQGQSCDYTQHIPYATFCSQVFTSGNTTVSGAGCGCEIESGTGKRRITCPCEENGCKEIEGGGMMCCCDTDDCNDPRKPMFTTTTSTTSTTTASTTTPTTTSPAGKKRDSLILCAFVLMFASVLL